MPKTKTSQSSLNQEHEWVV